MYNVNRRWYNFATCWGFFGKPTTIIGLVLRPLVMYPIIIFAALVFVAMICQTYYLHTTGKMPLLFTGMSWHAFTYGLWYMAGMVLKMAVVLATMLGAVLLVVYTTKYLQRKAAHTFGIVIVKEENSMTKLDGTIEKKPMLTESDDTPVLTEVVTDDNKPIETPTDEKKPL